MGQCVICVKITFTPICHVKTVRCTGTNDTPAKVLELQIDITTVTRTSATVETDI